ncbi:MAG: two-component system, NtrC family, sensor histidine kinase KinB [Actinomycetota bacterium]
MRFVRAALVPLVVAAVAVAAWVGAVGIVRRADRPSVDAHRAEMTAEARLAASLVQQWFDNSRGQLNGVKAALQPWTGSGAQQVAARAVLGPAGNFEFGFLVLGPDSRVAAFPPALGAIDRNLRPSAAVDAALRGIDAAGDVVEDPFTHDLLASLTTPLAGPGHGVLVGFTRLPTGSLAKSIAAAETALGHPVEVVTGGGTIVAPVPPNTSRVIQHVDDDVAPAVATAPKGAGTLTYAGAGGTRTVAAFAPLPEGWSVVLPRPAASLAVTGDRATSAAAAALATVLAAAFAVIVALYALLRRRTAHVEESKKAFLAIAGHELRTPLTVMKGYTELLVERWDDVDDETRHGIVETVSFQVRNLEHLVERLLLGAQLEAGVAPSTVQDTVALGPLLEEQAQHQRGVAPTHRFVVDVPDGLSVRGDTTALNHVVTNLVENAVKYSPDGGTVTMRAEAAERDRVRLTIDDEGIGLPGDLDIIFEKFVQREAVDRRVHDEGGVGLGLFIVRTLVEQMGGTVRAQRRHPKGSSFVVTLRRS